MKVTTFKGSRIQDGWMYTSKEDQSGEYVRIEDVQKMQEALNLCKQTLVSDKYLYDTRIQRLLDTIDE